MCKVLPSPQGLCNVGFAAKGLRHFLFSFRLCNKNRQLLEERHDKNSLNEFAKTPGQLKRKSELIRLTY